MKNTRKLLAAVMALTMVSAVAPMSAFADTEVKQNSTEQSGEMKATYEVEAKYTVTIPAGVTLNAEENVTSNITAENVLIAKGKQVVVKLTGGTYTTEGSTFHAKKGDSTAEYTISAGGSAVSVGGTVATFSNGTDKQTSTLTFSKPKGWTEAGEHTETLTFGIEVEDSVESVLAPALENGATMVVTYRWNGGRNTTTFTFTNNDGTYSCNIGGSSASDFSGSLTLNGTTLALSITNSFMSDVNLAINFDTTNDTYSFVTKDSSGWYGSHTVSVNGTDITDQLTEKN